MNGTELKEEVRTELNRPPADDLFDPAGDGALYYSALTWALKELRKKVGLHYPGLIRETDTLSAADSAGETYLLTDDHLGELELYTPPGVRRGNRIYPGSPGQGRQGFWTQGRTIYLSTPKVYTPGLYVRWVPVTPTVPTSGGSQAVIDANATGTGLPAYTDRYLIFSTCRDLAQRPGSNIDFRVFERRMDEEWFGRQSDPSDVGIIGTLKRQEAQADVRELDDSSAPWWRGLPG